MKILLTILFLSVLSACNVEPRKCIEYSNDVKIKKIFEVITQIDTKTPSTEINTVVLGSITNSKSAIQYRKDTVIATLTDIEEIEDKSYLVFCDGYGIVACDNNDEDAVAVYPSATSSFRKIGDKKDTVIECRRYNHN